MVGGGGRPEPSPSLFAAKAKAISVIWREHFNKCSVFLKFVDSTPIHVACKIARRYGKDCESEVRLSK